MEKSYENIKKLEEKHSEVEFQAEVPLAVLEKGMTAALLKSGQNFEMPGFRKGKVPEHILRERVDEMDLLEEAADQALRTAVREIIVDENLEIVGSPRLTITKIAIKNPVTFKVRFAIFPEIKLPDYKKIGHDIAERKDDAAEVTEKEIDEAIERLQKLVAPKTTAAKKPTEEIVEALLEGKEAGATTDAKPALTDDYVKQFGNFKDVADFKAQLKDQLAKEKTMGAKEAKREDIMREIVQQSKAEIPEMLMDEEWYAFEEERNAQLKQAGLTLEDYLKQAGKKEKDLEKEERALIEERIKTSMVFREMQKAENITANEKEIQTNIAYLKLQYKDRDERWLHQTAEAVIIQEKIFDMLGLPLVKE